MSNEPTKLDWVETSPLSWRAKTPYFVAEVEIEAGYYGWTVKAHNQRPSRSFDAGGNPIADAAKAEAEACVEKRTGELRDAVACLYDRGITSDVYEKFRTAYLARKAFTLVELLVVMFVQAILIALLLPAINGAVRRAKDAHVNSEINLIETGLAAFKSIKGQYPPSKIALCESGDYSPEYWTDNAPELASFREESRRRLNAVFNRAFLSPIPLTQPLAVKGGYYEFNGNGKLDPKPYLLTGDECLVFFLGGLPAPHEGGFGTQGFAKSQTNPFANESLDQLRDKPLFEFNAGRLVDLDGDGIPNYVDPMGKPYAYFSAYNGSGYDPDDCNLAGEAIGAFATARGLIVSPGPNPYTSGPSLPVVEPYATGNLKPAPFQNSRWLKPETYQIVSAGRDGVYGPGGWWVQDDVVEKLPYPAIGTVQAGGPAQPSTVRNDSESDNLTNFSTGPLR